MVQKCPGCGAVDCARYWAEVLSVEYSDPAFGIWAASVWQAYSIHHRWARQYVKGLG
jgi:hypothetical protein